MPRKRAPPRLYLDGKRRQWVIRDGRSFIRTGLAESRIEQAEKQLARYLGQKYQPEGGPDPLVADVLLTYAQEHVPTIKGAKNTSYNISSLARFFGSMAVSQITANSCRKYASGRSDGGARRDLEVLRAALGYYRRERQISGIPRIILPPRGQARTRWLTRREAARLIFASRHTCHLVRFILIGLYTGSRPGNILRLQWEQIDLSSGVMARRRPGEAEDARKRTPPVRLGRRILTHLRRWQRLDAGHTNYVCHYNGAPVAKLRRSFPDAARRAGLSGISPHTLRHTRATWLMQAGVDMWEAAGHLGMSVEVLTKVYGHHHPDWQKKAAEV